jgi:hypothetical protein
VQRDRRPSELGELEDIREQVLGKDDAAGPDKGYFDDLKPPWSSEARDTYFMPVLAIPWMK